MNQKLKLSKRRLYTTCLWHLILNIYKVFVTVYSFILRHKMSKSDIDLVQQLVVYGLAYGTNWNMIFQSVFLVLALVSDVVEVNGRKGKLARNIEYLRDVIFSGLVVPFTLFVSSMFWSLYAIDRELVFPQVYDSLVPWWFNQCVHTNILIVVAAEIILVPRTEPRDSKVETRCVVFGTVLYAVVYYSIYFATDRWLYQIFGIMTWWQVCLFQCLIWLSSYTFYRIQFPISRLIHGKTTEESVIDGKDIELLNCKKHSSFEELSRNNDSVKDNGERLEYNEEDSNDNVDLEDSSVEVAKEVIKEGIRSKNVNVSLSSMIRRNSNSPPFADDEWSLKYRNLRDQFEKTCM